MFDLAVIGSGPAGYTSAVGAALRGARVALIERGLPGGTCLNQGCVPSHALLHLAALIDDVRLLQGRGLAGDVRGDFAAALAHKDVVVRTTREGVGGAMKRLGVTVVRGAARFAGPGKISVTPHGGAEAEYIDYRRAVVATGSSPRALAECPVDGRVVMDSRAFMFSLDRLPREVLCVGGGAIGVELGFVLAQFGARVRIVERRSRLLDTPRVPEDASDLLERRLAQLGVDVHLGGVVAKCESDGAHARVTLSDGHDARYDLVLVAVGRVPNLAGLAAACQSPRGLWLLKDLSYCHPSWCEELERAVDASAARFARSAQDPFRPGIFAQEFVGPSPTNRG